MKKILLMLAFALVALAGCKKDPMPVFNVTSEQTMNFEAAGGNGTITYTIENPSEALRVIAQCEAEWITDITVGDQITFNVAENKENEAREATIAVAYGNLGFVVKVTQESLVGSLLGEWEGEEYSIKISKLGSGDNKINIRGFPQNGVDLTAYVTYYNTIRVPNQYYFDRSENDGEIWTFQIDFIPLNEEEVMVFDSDHIYISDSWELGYYILERYVTNRGKADILTRVQ